MDLTAKTVLITGASSGIGVVTAERFAREGANVALLARSREGLEKVAERVRGHGVRALVIVCDVADADAVDAAVRRTVNEFGGLDVVVSNAAAVVFGRFEEVSKRDFDRTTDIVYTGAVNVIRSSLPFLARTGDGRLIVIGSIMTKVPLPTFSSYAGAKHALRGFLGSLRIELRAAGDPVKVTLINPGSMDTPLWEHTTTATGRQSRKPPDAYKPEVISDAILDCIAFPRSELTVGGTSRIIEIGWQNLRPAAEVALGIVHRLYRSGKNPPPPGNGSLWDGTGAGEARDGMHGRPSLWMPIRKVLETPVRMVSRR